MTKKELEQKTIKELESKITVYEKALEEVHALALSKLSSGSAMGIFANDIMSIVKKTQLDVSKKYETICVWCSKEITKEAIKFYQKLPYHANCLLELRDCEQYTANNRPQTSGVATEQ